jgi:hypothetical protein
MTDQQAAIVEADEVEAPGRILELLRDDDVVSLDSEVRTQVAELGKELEIESREIIIFVHRKFIIVAYKW